MSSDAEYGHLDDTDAPAFVVWSRVDASGRTEAKHWIGQRRGLSALDAAKEVNEAIRTTNRLALSPPLQWAHAVELRDSLPSWAPEPQIAQQGYQPEQHPAQYCPVHGVWFGGVIGCPICRRSDA